jgi:dTDP-D-glucose 4,6-dehydratase
MRKLLVTGSSGLIGSEVVDYFCNSGGRFMVLTIICGPTFSGQLVTPAGMSTALKLHTRISFTTRAKYPRPLSHGCLA